MDKELLLNTADTLSKQLGDQISKLQIDEIQKSQIKAALIRLLQLTIQITRESPPLPQYQYVLWCKINKDLVYSKQITLPYVHQSGVALIGHGIDYGCMEMTGLNWDDTQRRFNLMFRIVDDCQLAKDVIDDHLISHGWTLEE